MKTFKFFKTRLVLIGVLIMSVSQMWAADVCQNAIIYFDNSASNWSYAYHYFAINDNNGWKMNQVTNTKLYVHKRTDNTWSGYSYIRLVATSGDWGNGSNNMKNWENIRDASAHYTNTYNNYGFGSDNLYWIKPANGDNLASLSVGHFGSSYTVLNKTITVKAKVSENDGASYSETTSPATLTASSHKFTAYNSCASSQSLSNGTITCGYTATTTLTAPSTDPSGYIFVGWYDSDGNEKTTGKTLTIYPTANATYYAYYRKLYTISAGTTVVWDEGNTNEYSSRSHWGSVYLRRYVQGNPSSTVHDALTHLGSGSQFYKTYNSASSNIRSFMFRSTNNDNSWSDNQQSTNIFRNVSGVTLFTYCGSATSEDTHWKLDWQVTTDGKKGASGKTIYFDDTYTSWKNTEAENREIYFNYGVDWSGGGYHRKIDFAVEKVPGTANLYKLKASSTDATNQGATNSSGQFGHDIYFQKWYVSKYYGYTNCNPITDSHVLERTEIYTDEIVSNDFTLIPTSKKSGGSGTDGSPYIWNTTKMTGHTHAVNIGSHTHGTITLSYTDESNTAQTPTESVNVAHTCIVSATATADNGYDYVSMTKGGAAYTPGTSHTVRDDVTFTATFTAHTYGITLNKGDHGAANQSATVDFDATGLKSVTHVSANPGYQLDGYYDGELKVLNANGSFAGTNVSGYITDGKWSKYDEDATLTAKFSPVALSFNATSSSSWNNAANWSPACVPTIEHDVTINKPAVVDIEHAAAKSIVLNQYSGNTGKLTIQANKGLEVEGTIRVNNAKNETVVTTPKDLVLQSSSDGNASLIFANTALDDRKDSATVYMYSKAYIPGSGNWRWQYIGLPFESANATYTYYGSYIWKFTGGMWETVANGATLEPWQGYSITNSSATTYEMEGELVSTEDKVFAFGNDDGQLLANSWTAPIYIDAFETEGVGATFTATPAEIYLFNTGSTSDAGGVSSGSEPGTYISVPVKSATYVGCPYIAPMQGFWISTNSLDGAGNVTLKYDELVRPASERAIVAGAMRSPKREQTEHPQVMKIFATGAKYSDRVTILSREDFSRGFDNGWDGEKISFGEEAPSIFVINGQDSYDEVSSIPEYEGTVIGFRSGTNNIVTISFDYDGEETLYLNDLRDQTSALISNDNTYEFSTSANDDEARFIISATPIMFTPTAVENNTTTNENKVQKIIFYDRVYIIRNGRMYDATGVLCK